MAPYCKYCHLSIVAVSFATFTQAVKFEKIGKKSHRQVT
jgi:hypothetical protein